MAQEITPRQLAQALENGQPIFLLDVRQPWENRLARLPGSILIPLNDLPQRIHELPAETGAMIVAYCHHGIRSLSAAAYLDRLGYHNVKSLAGGLDAWSCEVDPAVPRY